MRYRSVQILLLLGETERAIEQCRTWTAELEGSGAPQDINTLSVVGEEQCLELIAGSNRRQSVPRDMTLHGTYRREFPLALLALSNGDRDAAREHLEKCKEVGDGNAHIFWVEAFLEQMRHSKDWPKENPKIQRNNN
jgi:hypothetical protein